MQLSTTAQGKISQFLLVNGPRKHHFSPLATRV